MLVNDIIDFLRERAKKREILDIRVGLCLTAVKLDSGECGLASTLVRLLPHPLPHLKLERLYGNSIKCLQLAASDNLLMSAIGMATVNALSSCDNVSFEGNVSRFLDINENDTVGMIGLFSPLIPEIRKKTKGLYIFEHYPVDGLTEYKPDWAEPLLLPKCDVAIISGTTFINKTIDGILPLCYKARTVAVIGPTTPMLPDVLKDRGITLLSGMEVTDTQNLLKAVSLGANTQGIRKWVRKINIKLH